MTQSQMIQKSIELRLLQTHELPSILPLIAVLNPSTPLDVLTARLQEMIPQGYQCLGAYDGAKLVGLMGIWIRTHFWCGRMIEPDNVIVDPEYRSSGVGDMMVQWLFNYGGELRCEVSDLNCYVTNPRGQKFWLEHGYQVLGFHYQKVLSRR